jgi:hypothetical protein
LNKGPSTQDGPVEENRTARDNASWAERNFGQKRPEVLDRITLAAPNEKTVLRAGICVGGRTDNHLAAIASG